MTELFVWGYVEGTGLQQETAKHIGVPERFAVPSNPRRTRALASARTNYDGRSQVMMIMAALNKQAFDALDLCSRVYCPHSISFHIH
jgi:hypothetical protein